MLREGHSYMRFLPSNAQPRYFCFVRVAQKYPCMVLHIGYIEGTPHDVQSDALSMLIQSLNQLSPPTKERGGASANKRKQLASKSKESKDVVSLQGHSMVTIVGKQLQRVMIRWVWSVGVVKRECVPGVYDSRYDSTISSSLTLSGVGGASSEAGDKLTQMEYLHCFCWQWMLPSPTPAILSALLE